nr:MAG TPA: hypothetical protein [Caudoviricetes sp.]
MSAGLAFLIWRSFKGILQYFHCGIYGIFSRHFADTVENTVSFRSVQSDGIGRR